VHGRNASKQARTHHYQPTYHRPFRNSFSSTLVFLSRSVCLYHHLHLTIAAFRSATAFATHLPTSHVPKLHSVRPQLMHTYQFTPNIPYTHQVSTIANRAPYRHLTYGFVSAHQEERLNYIHCDCQQHQPLRFTLYLLTCCCVYLIRLLYRFSLYSSPLLPGILMSRRRDPPSTEIILCLNSVYHRWTLIVTFSIPRTCIRYIYDVRVLELKPSYVTS